MNTSRPATSVTSTPFQFPLATVVAQCPSDATPSVSFSPSHTNGSSRTAQAQALASKPPEVDSLAVRIVTDNQIIKFIPTEKRDGLTIERKPGGYLSKDAPPRAELVGEWGLSMHAESRRGSEVRNILIDFGYQSETLLNNMSVLNIDAASFDALVLSHGHYDHFGGMVGFLSANKGKLKNGLPFLLYLSAVLNADA